jgi:hypothetical protein
MAYRYRRPSGHGRVGRWELLVLVIVLAGGYLATVLISHSIGFDLSGLSTVATYFGYNPPDRTTRAPTGFTSSSVTAVAIAPSVSSSPVAANTYCSGGETPHYANGFQLLKDQLGDAMGDPMECEHVIDTQGDTQQMTSTGLASYDKRANATIFSQGPDHWQINATGLTQWTGDTPPTP